MEIRILTIYHHRPLSEQGGHAETSPVNGSRDSLAFHRRRRGARVRLST